MKRKAFVKGVSVLDSNPDAYKFVKKKYKMRSAGDGMKISNNDFLYSFIKELEGNLPYPQDIGDGKITIGSGLTNPKWINLYNKKGKWTEEDNRRAVIEEIETRRKWAEENVPNWNILPLDSQNALLSYKYNYDFNKNNSPKLYEALSNKDYEEAAKQIDATSSNPKFKKGLLARRQREQELFRKGIDSTKLVLTPKLLSKQYGIKPLYKKGGILKAQEGNKLTGWQKVGNFLNSDYGNLILNGVQQGLSYFSKPKSNKVDKEAFIKNYIAQNSVNPNQFYQQAYQEQVTSPDVHASDIVARNTAYKIAQQYNSKLKNDANAAWAQYQIMQNSGQQSSNNFLGLASNILGGIGQFIGNKSTSTDGQTEIATTPEKAIQTTASPKIPSVYSIAEKQILPIWQNIQNPVSNIGWKQPL